MRRDDLEEKSWAEEWSLGFIILMSTFTSVILFALAVGAYMDWVGRY